MNDYSLFVRNKTISIIVLLVYLDDVLLTWNSLDEINKVNDFSIQILNKGFGIFFLGIEVIDKQDGLCLTQRKYCLELLHEFQMLGSKHVKMLLYLNFVISEHGIGETYVILCDITEYQKLIGKLIYLTLTRPYISYIVQILSRFMHCPRKYILNVAFCVLFVLEAYLLSRFLW